jgi:two-component system chemotaxis response regulator CheY
MEEVADEMAAIAEELRELDDESDFELDEADNAPVAGASTTYSLQLNPDKTLVDIAALDRQSVLLVEPSRVQASIVSKYLESFQMNVAGVVATGTAALEEAKRLQPQAIVCSLHLPDMTGLQLAEQIRAESEREAMELAANEDKTGRAVAPGFVLITTSAEEVAADSLVTLRRVLPLTKPFTSEQLKAALDTVMTASIDVSAFSLSQEATEVTGRKLRKQARVLIVDDSSTARKHIRAALSNLGFAQFTEVADGAEAIAMAANSFCDLIITDYNMPLMDGRAMVSYFKQNVATAGIPIIMVTTESDPRLLEPVRRLGVLAIVDKTFPLNVVEPILDSLF